MIRKLLKNNGRIPDCLFIRNMAVPPVYNVDANVQGLSQIILQEPYVDAKLRCTEAFITAMSLQRAVEYSMQNQKHFNAFKFSANQGIQVHIPDGFDNVLSPFFPLIEEIEKAWDGDLTFDFSLRQRTLQLIAYQYLPFCTPGS